MENPIGEEENANEKENATEENTNSETVGEEENAGDEVELKAKEIAHELEENAVGASAATRHMI